MKGKMKKLKIAALVSLVLALAVFIVVFAAVTIDSFDSGEQAVCVGGSTCSSLGWGSSSNLDGTSAIDDERDIFITDYNSTASVLLKIDSDNNNSAFYAAEPGAEGKAHIVWDGNDNNATGLDPVGLGDENLGTPNDTIVISVISSDHISSLTLIAFEDASNYSTLTRGTPGDIDARVDIVFPFDSFTDTESGANFSSLGALELIIDGTINADLDILIDNIEATNARDYGDLATGDYGIASHISNGLRLGASVDVETATQTGLNASGDDNNDGNDDEDGVTRMTGAGSPAHGGWTNGTVDPFDVGDPGWNGGSMQIIIAGGSGYPQVFISWGNDGNFSEVVLRDNNGNALSMPLSTGTHRVYFDVPAGTYDGSNDSPHSIRVRLSSGGGLSATGDATVSDGGEVEDYYWNFGPTAVTLSNLTATSARNTWIPAALFVASLTLIGSFLFFAKHRREQ